jgi:hypothetical protein
VQRVQFDPVDIERSLDTVGKLLFVSSFYVGINRPIDVGPIPLHLTLWAIVTPFLLIELNRLRQAILSFAVAMASLADTHGPPDLDDQWRHTRRLITVLALCWSPAAVMVLVRGDLEWPSWAATTLVVGGMISGAVVLLRLASATWRTRSWLEGLSVTTRP